MKESIIRLPEVLKRTGLSKSRIYWMRDRGKFPMSVPLGERAVGWVESEVDQWIAQRKASRPSMQGVRYD